MSEEPGEPREQEEYLLRESYDISNVITSPSPICFICFEELSKIQSIQDETILTMSRCGCREYVHPTCIGQWIESHYEDPYTEIRCPICNTTGTIQTPQPLFTRNQPAISLQRFFARYQRNQTQHFNQLLLVNPLHPRHQANIFGQNGQHRHQIDMKRFLMITCAMFSMAFVLIWMLFIFDISSK